MPHRAQRAALQQAFPELCVIDPASGLPGRSAIDTVERFQGGERTVILVSATESDRAYLLASSEFLLDPRRLTVALSRAKRKMILVASRSIFSLFSPDEETFANSLLWKNLLLRTCTTCCGRAQGREGGGGVGRSGGSDRAGPGLRDTGLVCKVAPIGHELTRWRPPGSDPVAIDADSYPINCPLLFPQAPHILVEGIPSPARPY